MTRHLPQPHLTLGPASPSSSGQRLPQTRALPPPCCRALALPASRAVPVLLPVAWKEPLPLHARGPRPLWQGRTGGPGESASGVRLAGFSSLRPRPPLWYLKSPRIWVLWPGGLPQVGFHVAPAGGAARSLACLGPVPHAGPLRTELRAKAPVHCFPAGPRLPS